MVYYVSSDLLPDSADYSLIPRDSVLFQCMTGEDIFMFQIIADDTV